MSGPLSIVDDLGRGLLFLQQLFSIAVRKPVGLRPVAEQIWSVSTNSLPTTALAGFFAGAIMSVQFSLQLKPYGALGYLGGLSTSGTIREIGPLLIAFMLSGKVGAFTAAELGTMKVTEQIDAIRCLGANPLREIILPRWIGIVISSFLLLSAGLFMSVFGGMVVAMMFAGISPEEFLRHIPTLVHFSSVISGLFKCFVFSLVLASICTYKGYSTEGGARGVGRSVLQTAVATMVGIVLADWLTTLLAEAVMSSLRG